MSEEKNIFDKKFVHFMWDDSLEGKEGFFADYIDTLIARVNADIRGTIDTQLVFGPCSYGVDTFPFLLNSVHYRFFYYDPNYECKRAYAQGRVIQCRNKGDDKWFVTSHPNWLDMCEYRVKPEKTWRPFKDIAELKQTWLSKNGANSKGDLYEPFIWIRDKERPDITRFITDFNGGCKSIAIAGEWRILEGLFDCYEFLDGTPCGVEEVE